MTALSRSGGRLTRPLVAACLAVPLVLLGTSAQAAGDDPLTIDNLPSMPDSEIANHRVGIDVPELSAITVPDLDAFEPEVEETGDETVVSLQTDVLFRFGESTLTSSATQAVAEAVEELPDDAQVAVVGHTDSVGSKSDNKKLSAERAEAVAEVIEDERDDLTLEVSGKGESEPVEPNERGGEDNPQGREKNRRVELRYGD
ncbi:OmpA family protein [Janibacter alittae]|uniref:OmpA family protein n=1 Tax=Janibacter alittae TaxID=3115209 RepID=A0ABZ2MH53_9MICO